MLVVKIEALARQTLDDVVDDRGISARRAAHARRVIHRHARKAEREREDRRGKTLVKADHHQHRAGHRRMRRRHSAGTEHARVVKPPADGQRQQHLDSLRDGPRQRRRLNDAVIDNLQ